MFEKFKELFSSENLLDLAYGTTLKMLEFDHEMYTASSSTLRQSDTAELPFDIKKLDRKINKYEREVRRNVLTHLSIAGTQNVVPGLVLVSIVIDVERIGDYTKNISELATMHPTKLYAGEYEEKLIAIEKTIAEFFPKAIEVLKEQDVKSGRQIMGREQAIASDCEFIIKGLVKNPDSSLSTGDAVTLALYARQLKRINAHLSNITSAIVNPFPRIGFREKKRKKS